MTVDNDTRGWILTGLSSLACIFGASFICIDIVIRQFPGQKNFNIQDSNGFLSCSLSLSAGVMLFSALYKMLPSSKSSLEQGGYSSRASAWILIACFLAGVWGIQIVSRIMHHFMPSEVVDCDHTHDDDDDNDDKEEGKSRMNSHSHEESIVPNGRSPHNVPDPELEPLLAQNQTSMSQLSRPTPGTEMSIRETQLELGAWNRASFSSRMTTKVTEIVSGAKASCDINGPCKGYSHPCGIECFKNLNARGGARSSKSLSTRPTLRNLPSVATGITDRQVNGSFLDQESYFDQSRVTSIASAPPHQHSFVSHKSSRTLSRPETACSDTSAYAPIMPQSSELQYVDTKPHHHHVPQNAFLSLSFQTSVAIALHKLPEGFITYATNHANPKLGFAVFLALAIHNVTEGFALALPIFLATDSRYKCLLYSLILGGLSQPIGAGIAAIWLAVAERGRGDFAPGETAYGGMFAATAGIMASVALNLLQQSFELSHNKGLCMFFVFLGMGILGIGSALTA